MAKSLITLGVEAGDTSLKLALYEHKTRKVLRTGIVEVSSHPLREVSVLEKVLAEWVQSVPGQPVDAITVAIPSAHAVVRTVSIPLEIEDHADYLHWEMSTALNSDLAEYVIDHHLIPGQKKMPTTAMVVAVRKPLIESLAKGIRRKDLQPKIVEVDAFSLVNLLEVGDGLSGNDASCVVKADRSGVFLIWAVHGHLHALRWCSIRSLYNKGRSEAFISLSNDMIRELSVGFSQTTLGSGVKKVFLCGELAGESDFVTILTKAAGQNFEFQPLDSFVNIILDAEGCNVATIPVCAGAIGAALRFPGDRA